VKAYYCDHFELPIAPRSRFPIAKYARLRERLSRTPELGIEFLESPLLAVHDLETVHTAEYVRRVIDGGLSREEERLLGFPWSVALVERARRSAGGTVAACFAALDVGVAVNLAGGTHHAKAATGAGYCLFNDVAIAARMLSDSKEVERVLIVDADVHQGDGTAEILSGFKNLYTFSIHSQSNFPRRKAASDLDLGLADGTRDGEYLRNFRDGLRRSFLAARPQFVLYVAGADPFENDRLGRLGVTKAGLCERDALVFERCRMHDIPLAAVMAGGYAANVDDIVDIHAQTVTLAAAHARRR